MSIFLQIEKENMEMFMNEYANHMYTLCSGMMEMIQNILIIYYEKEVSI